MKKILYNILTASLLLSALPACDFLDETAYNKNSCRPGVCGQSLAGNLPGFRFRTYHQVCSLASSGESISYPEARRRRFAESPQEKVWSKGELAMIDPRQPQTPEQIKELWPVLVFLPEYMREEIDPQKDVQSEQNPDAEWPSNTRFTSYKMYAYLLKHFLPLCCRMGPAAPDDVQRHHPPGRAVCERPACGELRRALLDVLYPAAGKKYRFRPGRLDAGRRLLDSLPRLSLGRRMYRSCVYCPKGKRLVYILCRSLQQCAPANRCGLQSRRTDVEKIVRHAIPAQRTAGRISSFREITTGENPGTSRSERFTGRMDAQLSKNNPAAGYRPRRSFSCLYPALLTRRL